MKNLFLLLCFAVVSLFAQNEEEIIQLPYNAPLSYGIDKNGDTIFIESTQPEFPGGINELISYIQNNFKYPKKAKKKGITGTVYVMFVVEKDGSITNVEVIKGVSDELNAEAKRVVESMPKWIPGTMRGKTVRARFTLPLKCKLPKKKK